MTLDGDVQPVWQDPILVKPAMGSRDVEAAMEVEEEIAQIASTLTRANDPRSWMIWVKFIKEEELYLGMNLPGCSSDRGRQWNLKGLYLDVVKYPAFPVSCSTDKLKGGRVISAKLADSLQQVCFEAWITRERFKSCTDICRDRITVGRLHNVSDD